MTESTTKRRIWIRNAIIIILLVLLVLTLFSNTILNHSLPEVAVQYPQYASIASRIRATGVVRHRGRTTSLATVDITDEEGTLLATGEYSYFCIRQEPIVPPDAGD